MRFRPIVGRLTLSACTAAAASPARGQSQDEQAAYTLQASPGPATATFTDVPRAHQQFRFVEALAASGITGGCGGGNCCPDAPLTRGQMAVFLATALGQHWPNSAPPPTGERRCC